jgi:hypothetical protein
VYSADRDVTLKNFGYCYAYKSWMVLRGFDYYFKENEGRDRGFQVTLLNGRIQGYDMDMMDIPVGAFVVTSNRVYGRYFLPQSMQLKPELTANAMAFYEWMKQQTPVRSFSGRGGTIDIWYIPGEDADPGEQIPVSPSCGLGDAD